jgi:hypothetical protein
MTRKTTLVTLLLTAATLACSSLSGATGDLAATETAIAAQVMTQLAPTQTPNPPPAVTQASDLQPPASPQVGAPLFNPFQNLTVEQESCLKTAWGDQAFQEITGFQRPPVSDEVNTMGDCGLELPPPPSGTGQPGGTGSAPGGQPKAFKDQTYFTTSSDGLTWAEGTLLAEKASVPEVIYTTQGVYWAYWVDFTDVSGAGTEDIGVARSADGVTWEKLGTVNFGDLGGMTPVDPDVMELPDGRLRMYFYDISGPQGQNSIYSAVSSDGITFALEAGTRFTLSNIYDPNVIILPDGRYRMYLNMQDIVSATSSDGGLTFTKDDGVRVEKGSVPGAIVLPDDLVRLYVCGKGISVYKSTDGLNFTVEKKGVIAIPSGGGIICDPSVTETPSGYLMVYKYNSGNQ